MPYTIFGTEESPNKILVNRFLDSDMFTDNDKLGGYNVNSIPSYPTTGKRGVIYLLYFNPQTNDLWYEERPRQLTLEEQAKELLMTSVDKYNEMKLLGLDNYTLEEVRQAKIEELKYFCSLAIYEGFTSTVTDNEGVAYEFGFNDHDQMNFNSQTNKINLWKNLLSEGTMTQAQYDAKFPLQWKSNNIGVVYLSESEFIQVTDDAKYHLLTQQSKYWTLEQQVLTASTISEIDSINW